MFDRRSGFPARAALIAAGLALAACGQKGPLYLPDEEEEPSQVQPRPAPASRLPDRDADDSRESADEEGADDGDADSGA